jgi:hypothetical protein
MSQEQNTDLIAWWNELSFPGKELYSLDDAGTLTLLAGNLVKERVIAQISPENYNAVIRALEEKYEQLDGKVKELEVEWIATDDKLKLSEKVAHIKDLVHHAEALGDLQKFGLLVHDWEHTIYVLTEENYAERLKLVELAETLAQGDDWKQTTQAFKDIADKWKQAGHIDKGRLEKLWSRIEAARKTFQERKRLHHEEEEKDMLVNLDLKIDLVEQAEAIAASEDWKSTTEAFHRLTEEWKTIGHTLNKKNEELWQRFLAAKSAFFEKKREHSARIQVEQENNYAIKLVLVEKAEALKDSTDWSATAQAYAALVDEWKKTGRVPQERSDELWKRFTDAQEIFFSAKRKHTDEIKSVQEQNYTLKSALLERAERLKNSTHWGEATTEMNTLMDEWKKIGPIARSHGNKMWEDFIGARKHFFARKDANREQRKQYAETQKVERVKQAHGMVIKLKDEIKEEEEKLADFKTGLENITPGKKAAELRAHLENLIAEGATKIKRLQEKYEQAQKDVGST